MESKWVAASLIYIKIISRSSKASNAFVLFNNRFTKRDCQQKSLAKHCHAFFERTEEEKWREKLENSFQQRLNEQRAKLNINRKVQLNVSCLRRKVCQMYYIQIPSLSPLPYPFDERNLKISIYLFRMIVESERTGKKTFSYA